MGRIVDDDGLGQGVVLGAEGCFVVVVVVVPAGELVVEKVGWLMDARLDCPASISGFFGTGLIVL